VAFLDTLGTALLLQVAFLVCSIAIVTIAPGAVALQRQFAAHRAGRAAGVAGFLRDLGAAMRSGWPLGVLLPIVAVGIGLGVPFWLHAAPGIGVPAASVLVAIGGLAAGLWLAVLAAADRDEDAPLGDWRTWLAAGWTGLLRSPLRALWGVVLLGCWLAAELSVPALVPIGSGIVPAVIAWVALRLGLDRDAR
jgi:hypothetical protein